eukprot:77357_1
MLHSKNVVTNVNHVTSILLPTIHRFSFAQLKAPLVESTHLMSHNIPNTKTIKFKIPANGLLDLSVASSPVQFKMVQGKDAEIHGYPLAKHKGYTINQGGVGIYSWKGCKIEVSGFFNEDTTPTLIHDDTQQSPIKQYLMAHSGFRSIRDKLSKNTDFKCINYDDIMQKWSDFDIQRTFTGNLETMGPRILILGPPNTGKSTLCKSLINWAQRLNDEPVYIDLDCGQNAMSIPGTLTGDIVTDYHIPWKAYESPECTRDPFIYYFGNTSPSHHETLYKHYISVVAMTMKKKMLSLEKQRSSGSIINTCGFIDGALALSIIKHIIHSFCVNYIIVMEHEGKDTLLRFLHDVNKQITYNIHICELPPSKSTKTRAQNERYLNRQRMCKQYFYGDKIIKQKEAMNDKEEEEKKEGNEMDLLKEFVNEYNVFERTYSFSQLVVYEVLTRFNGDSDHHSSSEHSNSYSSSSDRESNNSNKKKGNKNKKYTKNRYTTDVAYKYCDGLGANAFKIKSKRFDGHMVGNIVAVTHAQTVQELLTSNVAGFIYIKEIDLAKKEIIVLQSCVGPLPGLCLFGKVKWDAK